MLTYLAFLISTSCSFHLFIQHWKNVLLKGFVIVGTGLIIEVYDDINR